MAKFIRARLTSLKSGVDSFDDNQTPLFWEEKSTLSTDEVFEMDGVGTLVVTVPVGAIPTPVVIELANKDTTAANIIRLTWTDATTATADSMDVAAARADDDLTWIRISNVDPTAAVTVTAVAGSPAWTIRAYERA